jgi:hypothetical protein
MIEPELYHLFPTPLYSVNFNKEFTSDELAFINDDSNYDSNNINLNPIISSNNNTILNSIELLRVKEFIIEHLNNFSSQVMCIDNPIFPTMSWLNKTVQGKNHYQHHHVNSIITGVFYFTDDPAPIDLHVDRNVISSPLKMFPVSYNEFNSHKNTFNVRKGDLILFPSYLEHSTHTTISTNNRISLSFNTWTSGIIGQEVNYSYLDLDQRNV